MIRKIISHYRILEEIGEGGNLSRRFVPAPYWLQMHCSALEGLPSLSLSKV